MADVLRRLLECVGFQWDEGNVEKSWVKHRVSWIECEEIFQNEPLLVASDVEHSQTEPRLYALGQTDEGRVLFVVFTLREKLIGVISARDARRRERREYEHAKGEAADTQSPQV